MMRSLTHGPSALSDGYEALSHSGGTRWKRMACDMCSSADDMTTMPLTAFLSMPSDERILAAR
jgi:hypothetical protein